MNTVWNIVQPYILAAIGTLAGGGIVAVIAWIICKRIINKVIMAYDINSFAAKVADKLGGKTLNVDLTAITEKRLKEISAALLKEVKTIVDETNSFKHILARIGEALAHLKMLTDDERAALVAAVNELDSEYKPPEKEVIATVKLEPIELPTVEPTEEESTDAVNFG